MTTAVLKFLPAFMRALKEQNANGNKEKSAGLTTIEWKGEMRNAVKDVLTETTPARREDLRKLMGEVFEHEFSARTEDLRRMMKEVIGDWADVRFGRGDRRD